MYRIKNKFSAIAVSSLLLFGGVLATDEVINTVNPSYQVVYADDIIVDKSTGANIAYNGDMINPQNANTGQANTYVNTAYLSSDGSTRYLEVNHGSKSWYVWKPDKSDKYGGTWESVGDNKVIPTKTKGNKSDAIAKFEEKNGYSYTATPTDIANLSDTKKTVSDVKKAPEAESGVSGEELATYNNHLSLGDKPNASTILASAILKGGGASGLDSANVSYSTLAQYAYPTQADAKIKNKDQTVNVYEYGNLQRSNTDMPDGSTTANIVRILTRYGWLTTNNNNEKETAWYTELMNNISNPVYAVGTIVATVLGVIADALTSVFQALIDGAGTVIGWLLPVKIFGVVTDNLGGISEANNWFTRILKVMIELIFGKGDNNTLKMFVGVAIAFGVIVSLIEFLIRGTKDGIKGGILSFRKIIYKLGIWSLGLLLLPQLYILVSSGGFGQKPLDTENFGGGTSFQSEKFFIATNGDISVLYPDSYSQAKGRYLSNSELDSNFKPTQKQIAEANQKVENILGSELSAQIDTKNKSNGVLDSVVSNTTWNVNDYLTGIETASDYSNQITANKLPSALSWESDIAKNQMTVGVTPTNVNSGKNIQDVTKQGWFLYKGTPVWFDNTSDSFNGQSDEKAYVSAGGWLGIKYSPSVYQPVAVSQKDTHTYLYGATSNNNEMTLNPANYTFKNGLTLNNNFQSFPKGNNQVKEGEEVKKAETVNGVTKNEISSKLEKPETALTSDNVQWRNAYMVAMFNKYAGTSDNYGTLNNMGFSNQSTMILLQSTYNKTKMAYSGYNTPNSKADNSKAQTKDNTYMPVYTNVGTGTMLSNTLSRTSYGLIARAIIFFAITVCIYQYGFGIIIKDSWVYFVRWLGKGSATGLLMVVVTTVYYFMLFQVSDLISGIIMKFVTFTITELQGEELATATTFATGLILVGLSLLVCMRLLKINNRKVSLISIAFLGFTVLYDMIKDYVERIDVAMYGAGESKTSSNPTNLDDTVSSKMRNGGGLVRTAVGSFVGNSLADKVSDDDSNDNQGQSETNGKGFRLPITPIAGTESSNSGVTSNLPKRSIGKSAIKGGMLSKRLMAMGSLGAMATPLGWGVVGYKGMRAMAKGHAGIKKSYNRLKDTNFGNRIGLNGRKQQLMSRYGLKNDNELASAIGTGKIKPRFVSSESMKQFQQSNRAINKLESRNLATPDKINSMRKLNTLGRNTPNIGGIRDTLKGKENKEAYIKNPDIQVDRTTKAVILAKSFAKGELISHIKNPIPNRREAYMREQANLKGIGDISKQ